VRRSTIDILKNFNEHERSIPWEDAPKGELVFGKYQKLDELFVVDFDKFVSWMKKEYGWKAGQCIIHDFNMRTHQGKDHPRGIAVDFHFYDISLFHQVMSCIEWGYRKVFFYPDWENPGIHVSYRYDGEGVLLGFGRYEEEEGEIVQRIYTNTHQPQIVREVLLDVA